MAKSERLEIAVTPKLVSRILKQIDDSGENKSEFVRRCVLEKLDALEAVETERLLIQRAVGESISA